MNKLNRYDLEFHKTFPYFFEQIEYGNTLSRWIQTHINFKQGNFFTLLPSNSAIKRLYEFRGGLMIPQKPYIRQRYSIQGVGDIEGQKVISLDTELGCFIHRYLKQDTKSCAILDHVMATPGNQHIPIDGVKVLINDNEVYYLLKTNNSCHQIVQAIKSIHQIWHFLIVLTKGICHSPKGFANIDLENVITNLQYIIAGAYDGEAYIFWEKQT